MDSPDVEQLVRRYAYPMQDTSFFLLITRTASLRFAAVSCYGLLVGRAVVVVCRGSINNIVTGTSESDCLAYHVLT